MNGRPLACITGASSGLGAEFARQLAEQGYDLLLAARRRERLESLAAEITARCGTRVEIFPVDLAEPEDRLRLEGRLAVDDRLDLLVNNAGFGFQGVFMNTGVESHESMVQVHILAPMRLIQAALPGMLARKKGGVINICSVAAFFPLPENVSYSATKAYLKTFSEALDMELFETGVRVQALCPGFTHTEFHATMGLDSRQIRFLPWMDARQVVGTSLRALRKGGPVVVIPGLVYRLVVGLGGLIPAGLLRRLARLRRKTREIT